MRLTSNRCVPVTYTSGRTGVAFCTCQIITFCFLYSIRTEPKIDVQLIIKETRNKWRPVGRTSCSDKHMYLTGYICFLPTMFASVNGLPHAVEVSCIPSCKGHYRLLKMLPSVVMYEFTDVRTKNVNARCVTVRRM